MKKIGDITNTADKNGEFTDGNVAAGIPPTQLMGAWFNSVQREILNVLIKAGVTQSKDRDDQLSEAIAKLIGSAGYQLEGYSYSKVESNLKFQPIGNYAPAGNYADGGTFRKNVDNASMVSPAEKYSLIIDNDGKLFTWDGKGATVSFSPTGELLVGSVPYSRLTDVPMVQYLGNSDSHFVSQKVVTDAVNGKQAAGNYADGGTFRKNVDNASMVSPAEKYSLIIDNDGKLFTWDGKGATVSFSPAGVMEVGYVPYTRVTGAPAHLGVGQSWNNMTSSRSAGVTYTNDTGKPIQLCVYYGADRQRDYSAALIVNGIETGGSVGGFNCIIPTGVIYRLDVSGSASLNKWLELR